MKIGVKLPNPAITPIYDKYASPSSKSKFEKKYQTRAVVLLPSIV